MGSGESSQSKQNINPVDTNWNPKGRVLLYVDNSNLYISTQAHAGKIQGFPSGVNDVTCRMHLHTLIERVVNGRNVLVRNAYGIMAPEVSEMLKRQGIKVTNASRSTQSGREKEADTHLTADGVEDVISKKPLPDNPNGDTVVLFSGDQDMCPLIRKARDHGWNVEVWAYTDSMADALRTEAKQANGLTNVKIMPLEDHFNDFVFYDNRDFNKDIPEDRALLLTFKDGVTFMNGLDNEKKNDIKDMVIKTAKQIFRLPVALKAFEFDGTQDIKCALIITLPEQDRAAGKPYYNFHTDVAGRAKLFSEAAKGYMIRNFGGDRTLEVTKYPVTSSGSKQGPSSKTYSRDELQCLICGVKGKHPSSKCNPPRKK